MCEKIIHEVDGMEIKVTELNEIIITNNLAPDNFHLVIFRVWSGNPNNPNHEFCIEFDPDYLLKFHPGELAILEDG